MALAGIAHSAIDISDGLVADLSKLLEASGVGAELDLERLPLSEPLLAYADREHALRLAMGGGDDYELCFTLPAAKLPDDLDDAVTPIGRITAGDALVCLDNGKVVPFDSAGYRHFQ